MSRRLKLALLLLTGLVVLVLIVFSIPLWTISAEEIETYTEIEAKTEYRKEPYTVTETYEKDRTTHSEVLYEAPATFYPGQWWHIWVVGRSDEIGVYENQMMIFGKPLAATERKPQSRMILKWSPLGVNKAEIHGLVINSDKLKITDELRSDPNRLFFHIIDSATWHEFASSGNLAFNPQGMLRCALMHAEPSGSASPNTVGMKLIYEWDEIEEGSREVVKYRDVPIEVPVAIEKQRTITKEEKVSFWKVLFSPES